MEKVASVLASLRTRLLAVVLAAVLPGVALTIHEVVEQLELTEAMIERDMLAALQHVSDHQHQVIDGARQLLVGMAHLREVRDLDSLSCGAVLAAIGNLLPFYYAGLAAAKPDGDIFCSSAPTANSANLADHDYFQQVLRRHDFAMSGYLLDRSSGRPIIAIGYPILDPSGGVRAVALVALDLHRLGETLFQTALADGSEFVVLDDRGTVLASGPTDGAMWVGKAVRGTPMYEAITVQGGGGMSTTTGLDGRRRIYAFGTLTGPDPYWHIFLAYGIPEYVAYSHYRKTLFRDSTLMGMVILLTLAGVWVAGERLIKRPVDQIVIATRRIAARDLSARVGITDRQGELGQLAQAFDNMADSLQQSYGRLHALCEIGQVIATTLHLREVLRILLEKIDLLLPYAAVTVRLFNKQTGLLEPIACRHIDEEEWKRRLPPTNTRAWTVFSSKRPLTVRNVQRDPRNRNPDFFVKHKLVSLLALIRENIFFTDGL